MTIISTEFVAENIKSFAGATILSVAFAVLSTRQTDRWATLVHHSMHGSAMQRYGRLRFPIWKHAIFGPPPHRNPLTDRYEILNN
jgi:hypothetical protein